MSKQKEEIKDIVDELINTNEKDIDESMVVEEEVKPVPEITDPEWHDYVMSHFRSDEMQDGNPTCDGLRRVAQLLIGKIVKCKTKIASASTEHNKSATVVVTISFLDKILDYNITYSGAADSSYDNTDEVYRTYPTAIAETRAEARALRKALNLRKVVSADELSMKSKSDSAGGFTATIEPAQIKGIDLMCKRLNINAKKFINLGSKQYNNVKEVNYDIAVKMMEELNKYQTDTKTIPESVVGYEKDWQTTKE